MYYLLYNMLSEWIYGADIVLTEFQDLTLTLISTIGVLFVVAIPFIVVFVIVCFIARLFVRL